MYIVYEGFENTYRIVIVTRFCKHGGRVQQLQSTQIFIACMAKPTAMHLRQRVCMQKLFLIQGILTVKLSPESTNALEKMGPLDTKNHQEDRKPQLRGRRTCFRTCNVNPGTSIRRVAMQEGISASSVQRILHHQLLYPYHIQRVEGLKNTDILPRMIFCQKIKQQSALDRQFLSNVLFTDETGLRGTGFVIFIIVTCGPQSFLMK